MALPVTLIDKTEEPPPMHVPGLGGSAVAKSAEKEARLAGRQDPPRDSEGML
jgi:hypothetical protein